jgi:hypothetical protein
MILQLTCLPMFLMSDMYQEFRNGVTDTAKTLFSRRKCQQFFGQTIVGPLRRQEILTVYGSQASSSPRDQKKRLKEELRRSSLFPFRKTTTIKPVKRPSEVESSSDALCVRESGRVTVDDSLKAKDGYQPAPNQPVGLWELFE